MIEHDRVEILGVDLLEEQSSLIRVFRKRAKALGIQLGWHYPLDLAWIASRVGPLQDKQILDAGAGTGVLQWWMAEQGAEVLSVDRADRRDLSCRFRSIYHVRGFRSDDLIPTGKLVFVRLSDHTKSVGFRLKGAMRAAVTGLVQPLTRKAAGIVTLFHQDLSHMAELQDGCFDAIVSVSALEHNDANQLEKIVHELMRVLKPGGILLATLGAAKDHDWYHEPSKGWCFTEETLKSVFGLSNDIWSNYSEYDTLLHRIRESQELKDHLAPMFFRSGENGMPWGIWDPKYQPVGVLKVK
jgi:ubiquinone/menaquinone biosynthesis C-methylase UbiE